MADTKTLITAEQLEGMSFPDERVELSEGELIRMSGAGAEHGRICVRLVRVLDDFVEQGNLGVVFGPNVGFRLAEHTVRIPDVSFVQRARVEGVGIPVGFWPGAPDLAVEVVSPSDSVSDLYKKIQEYFQAGTRLVWVVFPEFRQVHVHRSPKDIRVLEAQDLLSGEDLLPGFSIPVEEFFK